MVGIEGISGIRQPAEVRRADDRSKKTETLDMTSPDDVRISPEAQRVAEVTRLLAQSESDDEVWSERVAEAQKRLEEGTYQVQAVVLQVAARISRYVQPSLQ